MTKPTTASEYSVRVKELRALSSTGHEIILSRESLSFRAGQLINIHGRDHFQERSYTICCGENDPDIRILFRHMPEGELTPWLKERGPGDIIQISGPYGEFTLRDFSVPVVFIATGTGIAPARAYARTHPDLDLHIYHGVRFYEDLFYRNELSAHVYHPCVSGEKGDGFHGRVSDRCRTEVFPEDSHFYLCGANEMIYEVHDILVGRGIHSERIFSEEYYYRSDE